MERDLQKAVKFIYIIGFSFWPELLLRREENVLSLGEILKQKAEEGVDVKLLLWKEQFTNYTDREKVVRSFFKESKVGIIYTQRRGSGVLWSLSLTHH